MALIKCGECGKEISDKANACLGCGAPVEKPATEAPPEKTAEDAANAEVDRLRRLAGEPTVAQDVAKFDAADAKPPVPSQSNRSEALGVVMLLLPAVAVALELFWIGDMNLLQGPGSALAMVSILTAAVTALLAATEASQLGFGKKGDTGPIAWFLFVGLLWIIGFPAYLYQRSTYGMKNLIVGGIAVAVLFASVTAVLYTGIESKKEELRRSLATITQPPADTESAEGTKKAFDLSGVKDAPKGWQVSTGTDDKDDSTWTVLGLDADEPIAGSFGNSETPTLKLQCAGKKLDAFLDLSSLLETEMKQWNTDYGWSMGERATATLRFDEEKANTTWLIPSTDSKEGYFPRPAEFARKLAAHKKLLVFVNLVGAGEREMSFTLDGLADQLPELRKQCRL